MSDLDIFPVNWRPQTGAQGSITPNILSAAYGDGYSQDIAVGINSQAEVWTLTWNLQNSDGLALWRWLKNKGGVTRFWWTAPYAYSAIKVKTTGAYTKTETDTNQTTITATFTQVFDPN